MRRLSDPRPWLAMVSLTLVLILVTLDAERTSPGPLNAAHSRVAELVSSDGCQLCHGDSGRSFADACGDCHTEVADQIADRTGLHGALEPAVARGCGACHPEHHGADALLVGERAFQRAGHASRDDYDHRDVPTFDLHGAHEGLACAECHPHADDQPLPADALRFLGGDSRCEACHDDPHGGRMAWSCTECHDQVHDFEELASFVHFDDFPLTGPHGAPTCAECHAPDSLHAVEELAGWAPPDPRTCVQCHASPHSGDFEEAASCETCHPVVDHGFGVASTLAVELHAASGFALEAPHAGLACTDCHPREGTFGERHPGRAATACAACHADPHDGQFDDASGSSDCTSCHASDTFHPSLFDSARHAATSFPLDHAHAAVDCAQCHAPGVAGGPARFRGTPTACADCHVDAHREKLRGGASCERCHVPTRFDDVTAALFDHGADTGFALEGVHGTASCESCHPRAEHPDANGRVFGFAADFFGEPVAECATCHADVHAGKFDAVSGGCGDCHVPTRFADVPPGHFDHAAHAGFPLSGSHADAACESCHPRSEHPDANGRAFGVVAHHFAGPPDACSTCHADAHDGAFDSRAFPAELFGRTGCARCHDERSFEGFLPGTFEHARWTRFALDGAHARLACESCHPRTPEPDAHGRRFGRAAGRSCADCHADPHVGQFEVLGKTDCARCHATGPDWGLHGFDHDRTRFPLDPTHADLDCGACHVDASLAGGGTAVRYRPLGTRCQDCHVAGGGR